MKNVILTIAIVLVSLAMVACGAQSKQAGSPNQPPTLAGNWQLTGNVTGDDIEFNLAAVACPLPLNATDACYTGAVTGGGSGVKCFFSSSPESVSALYILPYPEGSGWGGGVVDLTFTEQNGDLLEAQSQEGDPVLSRQEWSGALYDCGNGEGMTVVPQ
jgi:hypothetical protein